MDEDYSIYTGHVRKFAALDYALFSLTLLVSASIGLFYAVWDRRHNTPEEFLLGGHKMHVIPVAMSLMVTFVSSLTLLGYPVEMYRFNTMFWWLGGCFVIAVGGSVLVFIPFFYRLGVTSTFEYLEMRFNKAVRVMGSLMMVFQTWLYMAFLLYGPSLSLNAVTGINLWGCVVAMGLVVTFYTTLGGMKAVLWTDTFQAGVIVAGLVTVIVRGSSLQGGLGHVWTVASNRSRIVFDELSVDPKTRHSLWTVVVGGGMFWLALYGVNQSQVQRCLSCPSIRKARLAMLLSFPGLVSIMSMACLLGIIMFAFYADCDPVSFGLISSPDQLVPLYVMDVLGSLQGLPGIFVSAVVSASLSSMSSGLNALSAITYTDLMVGCGWRSSSALQSTLISKMIVLVYGVGAMGLAWVVSQLGGILQALYLVFGLLSGPLLGVFTLGMFFPWANSKGAIAGQLVSTGFLFWVGLGAFANNVTTPPSPLSTSACNWSALQASTTTTISINSSSSIIINNSSSISTTTFNSLSMTVTDSMVNFSQDSHVSALEPLYKMSYMWYTGLGMVVVWTVGLVVSFLTGATNPAELDPRLICPLLDVLVPCLPQSWRSRFYFGVPHGKDIYPPGTDLQGTEEMNTLCERVHVIADPLTDRHKLTAKTDGEREEYEGRTEEEERGMNGKNDDTRDDDTRV